jgi:hypothetical protein
MGSALPNLFSSLSILTPAIDPANLEDCGSAMAYPGFLLRCYSGAKSDQTPPEQNNAARDLTRWAGRGR